MASVYSELTLQIINQLHVYWKFIILYYILPVSKQRIAAFNLVGYFYFVYLIVESTSIVQTIDAFSVFIFKK